MNERMRFDPAAAMIDGRIDADDLIVDLRNLEGDNPATILSNALAGIIGLAIENRIEECQARLTAFCSIVAPVLEHSVALEAKSAMSVNAECPQDSIRCVETLATATQEGAKK